LLLRRPFSSLYRILQADCRISTPGKSGSLRRLWRQSRPHNAPRHHQSLRAEKKSKAPTGEKALESARKITDEATRRTVVKMIRDNPVRVVKP
jgi:hypothetical protein